VVPRVTVPLQHAVIEFKSERLYTLVGKSTFPSWGPIGGLHKTADGYVRIHDNFSNHRQGALQLLGLPRTATLSDVAKAVLKWNSEDLETAAFQNKMVISALRSYKECDILPQAKSISDFPIII